MVRITLDKPYIPIPVPAVITSVKYGLLYNWYAATDVRNIAAAGWEVPNLDTINELLLIVDPDASEFGNIAGDLMKEVGTTYWDSPSNGTNSSGFNAKGSGIRIEYDGRFFYFKKRMYFWCRDGYEGYGYAGNFYNTVNFFYTNESPEDGDGVSIRLIKTTTSLSDGEEGTYTGNDGKVYRTICIGTQEWLADNLCETKYRNGDTIPEVTDNSAWAALTTGALCAYNNDWSNVLI